MRGHPVKGCGACQKFRPAQPKETYKSDEDIKEIGPWDKVGVDLFVWENDAHLVVVDYYPNFPEISKLSSTSSESVITHIKSIFARHGIP